jgi:hypothetical protein
MSLGSGATGAELALISAAPCDECYLINTRTVRVVLTASDGVHAVRDSLLGCIQHWGREP